MSKENKDEIWRFLNWAFMTGIGYLMYADNPALGTICIVFASTRFYSSRTNI